MFVMVFLIIPFFACINAYTNQIEVTSDSPNILTEGVKFGPFEKKEEMAHSVSLDVVQKLSVNFLLNAELTLF